MAKKLRLNDPMEPSYLIQRLEKPIGVSNPFWFGGGLDRGGISQKAMDVLKQIFSFDYMGSAEFEWGEVPAALDFIAEQTRTNGLATGQHKGVYFICPKPYLRGVRQVINDLLKDEQAMNLKARCGLKASLEKKIQGIDTYVVGWLELDNGFFLFTDEQMYENTKLVFGA